MPRTKKIKASSDAGTDVQQSIADALERCLEIALSKTDPKSPVSDTLSFRFREALVALSKNSEKASAAFTNIITCLAVKTARPNIDIRYHQVQIQDQTNRPAGFTFRSISEDLVYPWLSRNKFDGAKSGWQTRTLERPKPYTLNYDENIGSIKEPFLACFDEVEEMGQSAQDGLAYLLLLQLSKREGKQMTLSLPKTKDVLLITRIFKEHFFYKYQMSKGASRLPVLALYSVYEIMLSELSRFNNMQLKQLQEHSAADIQTGSLGDIEVVNMSSQNPFEVVEVKHNIGLSDKIIQDVQQKVMSNSVQRYYILTTHANCEPKPEQTKLIEAIKSLYDCEIIANGVLSSLKYYLRLLSDPSLIFPKYVELLKTDKAIAHEHREAWNRIAINLAA